MVMAYQESLISIKRDCPSKDDYSRYILIKITTHYERTMRIAAEKNSKMSYFNVATKGLNGRFHPALQGVSTTQGVSKIRVHKIA